jgi:prepilin peptidase CpaA
MTDLTGLAILAVFPLCMIFATFYDLFTMTIPNRITFCLLAAFAVFAPLAGMGWETAAWHIGVALVVLVVGFGLFSLGVMGGGDAKLLAASALWFGTAFTLPYLLAASVLGGVLTLAIVIARRITLPRSLLGVDWIARLHDKKQGIPYGAALGPAALYVFAGSPWMSFVATGQSIN